MCEISMINDDECRGAPAPEPEGVAILSIKQILRLMDPSPRKGISSSPKCICVGTTRERPFVSIFALLPLSLRFHLRKCDDGTIPSAAPALARPVCLRVYGLHTSISSIHRRRPSVRSRSAAASASFAARVRRADCRP